MKNTCFELKIYYGWEDEEYEGWHEYLVKNLSLSATSEMIELSELLPDGAATDYGRQFVHFMRKSLPSLEYIDFDFWGIKLTFNSTSVLEGVQETLEALKRFLTEFSTPGLSNDKDSEDSLLNELCDDSRDALGAEVDDELLDELAAEVESDDP